jgi:hypothetical protein
MNTHEGLQAGHQERCVLLRHPETGEPLKPTLSPAEVAPLLGWPERTVREYARKGLLPTMARAGTRGQYRIITARLLEMLGLAPVAKSADS